ncbi:hypothetical protein [Phormidium sp. CCY1219]|nr:hypothetical protein [Phormidium sp. CCY1219]
MMLLLASAIAIAALDNGAVDLRPTCPSSPGSHTIATKFNMYY